MNKIKTPNPGSPDYTLIPMNFMESNNEKYKHSNDQRSLISNVIYYIQSIPFS